MNFNSFRNIFLVLALALPVLLSSSRADAYAFLHECAPTWSKLPVRYKINQNGSRDFPDIAKVETIFKSSFSAWEEPCCSNFRSQYDGLTTLTANNNQGQIILSFSDASFPREYGGSETIAVTLISIAQSCTIIQAPILFNGFNHRFRSDGREVDLESVTTHEVGHLLGLDHSNLNRATMFYAYTGGTSARILHDDDVQGVCALYPRVCSCSKDSECPGEEQCIGSQCEKVPCTSDTQCAQDLVCRNGDCVVPPCSADTECAPGFQCSNQVCVSICPTCRTCKQQSDCGGNGHCVDYESDGNTKCMVLCSQGGLCPGDSECFQMPTDNQTLYLCLNADAQKAGLCPASYTCKEPVKDATSCVGVTCGADQQCMLGKCESKPGQPDPGNPNPDTGGTTPDTGNNNPNDEEEVVIIGDNSGGRSSDCSSVSFNDSSSPAGALTIALAGGLFVIGVRRRRRNN